MPSGTFSNQVDKPVYVVGVSVKSNLSGANPNMFRRAWTLDFQINEYSC